MRLTTILLITLAGCGHPGSADGGTDAALDAMNDLEVNGAHDGSQASFASHVAVITIVQTPFIPRMRSSAQASSASIFFGGVSTDATQDPVPITGATITITDGAGHAVSAPETGQPGNYLATSLDGGFNYQPGSTYSFDIVDTASNKYTATGTAPGPEVVSDMEAVLNGGVPIADFALIVAGSPYTLHRSAAPVNGQLDLAFVSVYSISQMSGADPIFVTSTTPTWTNAPQRPRDFLDLIQDDASFRQASITIPGGAFPTTGFFLVALTAVSKGAVTSSNLLSNSAILLGTPTAGAIDAR